MKRGLERAYGSMRIRVLGLLILAPLSSCVQFEPYTLDPQGRLEDFGQRSLDDQGLVEFLHENGARLSAADKPWGWLDLTLVAYFFSPKMSLLRAQWEVAQRKQEQAIQRPNPTLGLAPFFNSTQSDPSAWTLGAALEVPIEGAGRRDKILARERFLADATRFDLRTAIWAERARLRGALVSHMGALQDLELVRLEEDELRGRVRLLEAMHELGALDANTVNAGWLELEQASLNLERARLESNRSRVELGGVLGLPGSALEAVVFSSAGLEELPAEFKPEQARRVALTARTDLLAELARFGASEAALQVEIAKQIPLVNLGPGYEFDQGDNKWGLGLSIELPLFHGNRRSIDLASARRKERAASFCDLQARLLAGLDQSLEAHAFARSIWEQESRLLDRQEQQETLVLEMQALGESSQLESRLAHLASLKARRRTAQARTKMLLALGALEAACQRPFGATVGGERAWLESPRQVSQEPRP